MLTVCYFSAAIMFTVLIFLILQDYDHYYASLAASAAPSAHDTPALTNFNEFGEEDEDVKPSMEYLNSLGDYRKRSRSMEDIGDAGPAKTPKLNGQSTPNGYASLEPETPSMSLEEVPQEPLDDPTIYGLYSQYCIKFLFIHTMM